jgi:cobalt-precorrin 5A hydrolase/precorrin-3B C17-methyltransferase
MQSLFKNFEPIAAIATTPAGVKQIQTFLKETTIWVPPSLSHLEGIQVYQTSLTEHLATLWQHHRALIFCLATGAVVRLIAPLLQHKSTDPAIIVIDEAGQFVISLCSGHQGGADQLTRLIAQQLNTTPIITGASTAQNLPGIDILGIPFGWQRGTGTWTEVSATIAQGEPIEVLQEAGSTLWQSHLPANHPFHFESLTQAKAKVWITHKQPNLEAVKIPQIVWHPRVLWIGIGCERGTSQNLIETALQQTLETYNLAKASIAGIATIDLKADETGILQLCHDHHFPLKTYPGETLNNVNVPNPSVIVEQAVGTPSVAEAAAILAAQTGSLLVSKQIYRLPDQPGAVTLAIAQASQEYTGRTGTLYLIGTGPGHLDQITPAARSAIVQADVIIGYSLYLDLICPLFRPGQIIESFPITQEKQRAQRAIDLANWGLTVAMVSSGDCGIYGMAGLVLEQLCEQNWDGKTPSVQVFAGISALQAAASRVGAPLMHDFCAISLSDLLTPWEVIEKRLNAAAMADFVTALYNPRSKTRTQQIEIAQKIFLQCRHPHTPVAIVRSACRDDEMITLTTLEKFLETPIDMLTTVLIGNSSTRLHQNWMITPRGYLGWEKSEN